MFDWTEVETTIECSQSIFTHAKEKASTKYAGARVCPHPLAGQVFCFAPASSSLAILSARSTDKKTEGCEQSKTTKY